MRRRIAGGRVEITLVVGQASQTKVVSALSERA